MNLVKSIDVTLGSNITETIRGVGGMPMYVSVMSCIESYALTEFKMQELSGNLATDITYEKLCTPYWLMAYIRACPVKNDILLREFILSGAGPV